MVMVVNNASGTQYTFGGLECKAPSNQNVLRYLYLPSLDLVQRELDSMIFWVISPRALYYIQPGLISGVYKSLI